MQYLITQIGTRLLGARTGLTVRFLILTKMGAYEITLSELSKRLPELQKV